MSQLCLHNLFEEWCMYCFIDKIDAYATTVDGGFTDFCVVNVELPKDDKRSVTGIKLEQNSVTLSKIGETVKLKATVLPADADNPNIQWESSDRTVCLVIIAVR